MLLSFLMFFFSCEDNRYLKNLLTSFEKETIALPQRVLKVENGKSGISTIQPEGKTLVIFFAPKECTSCAFSHLKQSESIPESFDSAPAASLRPSGETAWNGCMYDQKPEIWPCAGK